MEVGQIFFVVGTSKIAKMVELFDGEFSHVAMAISKDKVIETNWNIRSRVKKPDYKHYAKVNLNLTSKQKYLIVNNYKKYLNKPYDFIQILGFILKKNLNNKRKLICSELVYDLLTDAEVLDGSLKGNVTPNELYKLLTTIKNVEVAVK